jgi:hypothetical protein
MTRTVNLLLVLCVAAASVAVAAPKNPDVERTVKSQLVKKFFVSKINIGSFIPCPPNVNTGGRNDAIKPIDTELSPDGSIRYYARANCFYSTAPGVIDLGAIFDPTRFYVTDPLSGEIPQGVSVLVRSVDFKEDRVEVNLTSNTNESSGHSGKIKYMLGAAYRTWSADEVMEAIARGIQIPAYEHLIQLKVEFETLRGNLDLREKQFNAPGKPPAEKLAAALGLKNVLEQLQRNRAAFIALGKSDPQAGVYTEKLNALLPEIARLSEEAHKQRVAHLHDQLQAQLAQITQIQAKVRQKPPSSLAEWQQRTESLSAYADLLDIRSLLLESLKSEKETPAPDDIKLLSDGKAEIATARQSLENSHQQIELRESASQYEQLSKKRAQLLNSYLSAFGTAKERPALQNLAVVLGQIVVNREQAVALGDKSAAAQLVKYRAEADKYKRR